MVASRTEKKNEKLGILIFIIFPSRSTCYLKRKFENHNISSNMQRKIYLGSTHSVLTRRLLVPEVKKRSLMFSPCLITEKVGEVVVLGSIH